MKKSPLTGLLLFLLLSITVLPGAYLQNQPLKLSQPDGSALTLFATGDEYYNWLHDAAGFTVKQDRDGYYKYVTFAGDELSYTSLKPGVDNPAQAGLLPRQNISPVRMGQIRRDKLAFLQSGGESRAPHSGTINNLVVFIRFSDQTEFGENLSNYSSKFNGTTGNTMQSYFWEASYNALNITTSFYPTPSTLVVSWQDSHTRAYFSPYNATTNPTGYQNDTQRTSREHSLLVAAVTGVRSQVLTSLNLDGDGDGNVDNVCFIIKGATDGWAELLWPHRWTLYSQYVSINSKRVYDYNLQLSDFTNSSGNGVLCHEMFHSLGSPDLYHYTGNGISPVGPWDLMENNSNPPEHMCAYMKWKYVGWIPSIPTISTPGTYTLNPLSSATGNCYRINSPNSTTQYFVVEFRKKTGTFESSVPGSGMLIYRINTAASGNASGPPDEVYVYRPGGSSTVNGEVNNAFFSDEAGRIMFNPYTNPWPFLQDGTTNGNINLMSISSSAGATMSFVLSNTSPLTDLDEGFEGGITTPPWTFSGNANWVMDSTNSYSGTKSAKSGTITHSQSSVMQMTQAIGMSGQISFFYKVSSESSYDYLKFYIDGTLKGQWSGEIPWAMTAFNVTAGDHTFKWEYMKDGSVNTGSDAAWVDHIAWPNATFNPPQSLTASSGNQQVVLNWLAPASGSPSSYRIYRDSVYLASTTNLTYSNTNLTNGTSYSYYVTAAYTNPSGESVPSNSVSATPSSLVTLTIGTGALTNIHLPIEPYYGYTYSQSIYLQSEINLPNKQIYKLAWYYNGNSAWSNDTITIYMGHTDITGFASTADWLPVSSLTEVYNGTVSTSTTPGWIEIILTTPFTYNNAQNLVIAVDENTAGYHASNDEFLCSAVTGNRSIYFYSDSVNPVPTAPPASGSYLGISANIPNVEIFLQDVPAVPVFYISPASIDYGQVFINTAHAQALRVTNTGGAILSVSDVNVSGTGFSLSGLPMLPVSLTSGQYFDFTAVFNPDTAVAYSGVISLTDNLSRAVQTVALNGSAIDPTINTFPWSEPFTTWTPSNWTLSGGSRYWAQYAATPCAYANLWGWQIPNNAVLITPPLRPTRSSNLSFKWSHAYNATYPTDAIQVSYSTDMLNWTEIWYRAGTDLNSNDGASNTTPGSFITEVFELPAGHTSQSFYIKFDAISGYGPDLYLDDVAVTYIPLPPSISVNPNPINLGEVAVNTVSQTPFTVYNTGELPLIGNIVTPEGFTAVQSRDAGIRNTLDFNITAGSSQTFTLECAPTLEQIVNTALDIQSNDPNLPILTVPIAGNVFMPQSISVYPASLSENLICGQSSNRTLTITNTGDRNLVYALSQNTLNSPTLGIEPSIAYSNFYTDVQSYTPGSTATVTFVIYNASPDLEWIKDITVQFPEGVTVNSSTDFIGGSGGYLYTNNATGNGILLNWHGENASGWGMVYGNETAMATVNVSFSAALAGSVNLPWVVNGDIYGTEPHVLNGTVCLPASNQWFIASPLSGTILPGQSMDIDCQFLSGNTIPGLHSTVLNIVSNAVNGSTLPLPVELNVGLQTPAPLIHLNGSSGLLDWTPVPGATIYNIYYCLEPDGTYTLYATTTDPSLLLPTSGLRGFFKIVAESN